MSIQIVVILIYASFMLMLAVYFSKREVKSGEDFVIAGHRLPLIVVIGTLTTTWVGSGSLVGGAGFVYQYGPLAAIFFFAGGPLGIIVMYFIASRTRALAKRTVPEMLETRFGSLTRFFAAIFILITYISVLTNQFVSGGYILNITTGLPEHIGALLTVIFVIALAALGGLFSVSYTDFFSAIMIIFGLLIAIPFVLVEIGGISDFTSNLSETQLTLTGGLSTLQIIGYFLPLFVYIIGDQTLLQRFSASKDETTAKRSTIGFFLGVFIIYASITILVTASITLLPNLQNPDTALMALANHGLPSSLGAIILAAFTALLLTTASSFLLSIAGNVVYDLYVRFKGDIPQKDQLKINRISVIAIGLLAYTLGLVSTSVLELSIFAYAMYGTAITPVILAAFFWKRANKAGAIASIVTGGGSTIIWELMGKPMDWNSVLVSLPLSLIALIVFSLFSKKPEMVDSIKVS